MSSTHRGWLAAGLATLFFGTASALPWLADRARPTHEQSAAAAVAVSPADVHLSPVATPGRLDDAPAHPAVADPGRMAALAAAEDWRLRTALHRAGRLRAPEVVHAGPGTPTLALPARAAVYTVADLQRAGAVIARDPGEFLLVTAVLAAPGATLELGGAGLRTLLMDSSASGFTSLVTWGGTMVLAGADAQSPLTIIGWDADANGAAVDRGQGRPYILALGGRMDLRDVRASSLGFSTGRTSGVAWVGDRQGATGGAGSSTFTGNVYGAYVSHGENLRFTDDLFQGNELDGLRLDRRTVGSAVAASSAVRNGGSGFAVSRGSTDILLRGNLAVQSGRAGVLVKGGSGTRLEGNVMRCAATCLAVSGSASGTSVHGNQFRCAGGAGMSIDPGVTGATVDRNTFARCRVGVRVRAAAQARITDNRLVPGQDGDAAQLLVETHLTEPSTAESRVLGYLYRHLALAAWLGVAALIAVFSTLARPARADRVSA